MRREDRSNDAPYVRRRNDAWRRTTERERHEDNLRAIHRVANELVAAKEQEQAEDNRRALREKVTIGLLIGTVLATSLGDVIFYGQMKAMLTANDDSRRNVEQQLAAVASQTTVMQGQLDAMKIAATQTDKMLQAATAQAKAATEQATAATASADSSRAMAEASRQSLIVTERAWVGPIDASFSGSPVAGKELSGMISYHNTGREPALQGVHDVQVSVATPKEDTDRTLGVRIMAYVGRCRATQERDAGEVTYPSTGFSGQALNFTVSKDLIDEDVVSGAKILLVQGCFAYRTGNQTHHSAYCYFFKSNFTKPEHLNNCTGGNYAD